MEIKLLHKVNENEFEFVSSNQTVRYSTLIIRRALSTLTAIVLYGCTLSPIPQPSQEHRSSYTIFKNLCYSTTTLNSYHLLDLYIPQGRKDNIPFVIYIHGGGWDHGDKSMITPLELLNHKIAVASINYSLSGSAKFPRPLEDCREALNWIVENGKQYGLDTTRIGIWGVSSGGHLALMLIANNEIPGSKSFNHDSYIDRIKAVCDWCGQTDLSPLNFSGKSISVSEKLNSSVLRLVKDSNTNLIDALAKASPINYSYPQHTAFLVMHGTDDSIVPVSQSRNFVEHLKKQNISVRYIELPKAAHNFYSLKSEQKVASFFSATL